MACRYQAKKDRGGEQAQAEAGRGRTGCSMVWILLKAITGASVAEPL